MARLTAFLTSAVLASTASAHFQLSLPDSHIGGSQTTNQDSGPCGGHSPSDDDDAVDFYVSGDAVAMTDGHSQSDWLIRGMLGNDADEDDWQQLYPIYRTEGQGKSCQPVVTAPESWAGQTGLIGIVGSATDGILYACAAVNFVNGTAPDREDDCTNATSVSIEFHDNDSLKSLADSGAPESDSSDSNGDGHSHSHDDSDSDSDSDDDSAASALHRATWTGVAVSLVAVFGAAAIF